MVIKTNVLLFIVTKLKKLFVLHTVIQKNIMNFVIVKLKVFGPGAKSVQWRGKWSLISHYIILQYCVNTK